MAMTKGKYQSDDGEIHSIIMSPDRYSAAGSPPAGAIDDLIKVKISKTNREHGIRPRCAVLGRTIGTDPDTFVRYSLLPVLTTTAFGGAGFAVGSTVTISGVEWTVLAKKPEDY